MKNTSLAHMKQICNFLKKHHVLTLSTQCEDKTSACCNLFFVYIEELQSFIVASDYKTEHIKNILRNFNVSGTVVLETNIVGKIQGVQFKGVVLASCQNEEQKAYYKAFPYAIALSPTLWKIRVDSFKFTDNTLGFGKKLHWSRE
ncbi:MAG: hypothetical protein GQ570_06095 [Helicobacteraceae bacterium]|nr:hypothetical protein [Helicobacteraceae bacterium]